MFRASSAHLQEDTVVHMQHMVLSRSMSVLGGLSVHSLSENSSCVPTGRQELWQYHLLHVYNCILLKMSTWGSKHVEENSILWINSNQCIKLVINIYLQEVFTCSLEQHVSVSWWSNKDRNMLSHLACEDILQVVSIHNVVVFDGYTNKSYL